MSGAARPHLPLPRLLLIADGFVRDPAVAEAALAAVEAGVRWVQLRDHEAPDEAFADAAERLAEALRARPEAPLVQVNSRAAVAERLGVGLHVGWRGPSVAEARRVAGTGLVTAAVHDADEALAAVPADALLFSPVFPTASKPGHPGQGIEALRRFCASASVPVLALGGITPARAVACRRAGAHGVAVVSAILCAPDPVKAARAFLAALDR